MKISQISRSDPGSILISRVTFRLSVGENVEPIKTINGNVLECANTHGREVWEVKRSDLSAVTQLMIKSSFAVFSLSTS